MAVAESGSPSARQFEAKKVQSKPPSAESSKNVHDAQIFVPQACACSSACFELYYKSNAKNSQVPKPKLLFVTVTPSFVKATKADMGEFAKIERCDRGQTTMTAEKLMKL